MKYSAEFRDIEWYRKNIPCLAACPVYTDSGKYVQLISEGQFEEAYFVARSPNPIASICARICAAPCEDACRRGQIDEAVHIRALKRFISEKYGPESILPDSEKQLYEGKPDLGCKTLWHIPNLVKAKTGKKENNVAVIGSGPAGLSCAHDLAIMGYNVTIFEATSMIGGMLRLGIPEYRLPRGVIEKEIGVIKNLGVNIKLNAGLNSEFGLKELKQLGFDAFFLAVGAMKGRDLKLPGSNLDGVIKAVDYLLNANSGYKVNLGEKVVVIGGGSVALDAARTAIREFYKPMEEIDKVAEAGGMHVAIDVARSVKRSGAEVIIASLESFDEMPAAKTVQGIDEIHQANEEGISFLPSWGPNKILGEKNVAGIELVECTRVFDEEGKFKPQFNEASTKIIEADSVILAIGQQSDFSFLSDEDGIELTTAGTIKVDPDTLQTTAPGVFAGGDTAFGPRIAIEAAANGKTAARSIHEFLSKEDALQKSVQVSIEKIPKREYSMFSGYETTDRENPQTLDTGRRTGIAEVEFVFEEEQAREQAERCLICHIDTIYDPELCVLCGRCADVCPEHCLRFVPLEEVNIPEDQLKTAKEVYSITDESEPLTVLLKDDTKCIRCGLCSLRCPTEAMTMEKFNYADKAE